MNKEDLRIYFLKAISPLKARPEVTELEYNEAIETQSIPIYERVLYVSYLVKEFHTNLNVYHKEAFILTDSGKIIRISFSVTRIDNPVYTIAGMNSELQRYIELNKDFIASIPKIIKS